jgi:hypothetical protein
LWQKVGSPFYGTRYQLRKKAYKGSKGNEVSGRLKFVFINIYGIAKCLKSVKTNSYRKDNVKPRRIDLLSEKGKGSDKIIQKEVIIFKKA